MDEKYLRDGIDYVKSVLRTMHESAEERSFDMDEQAAWDAGVDFVRTGEAELVALEERKSAIAEFAPVATGKHGDGAISTINVNTHTVRDAFDHETLTDRASPANFAAAPSRSSKSTFLPMWTTRPVRPQLVSSKAGASTLTLLARHIVRTSSPSTSVRSRSTSRTLRLGCRVLTKGEARTAMSLTAANGGVLVPQFLDPTIVLTNGGSSNQVRQISDVTQITVDQWDGVTSAGVTAEWLAEGTEAGDATPTFVGPTISVHKAAACCSVRTRSSRTPVSVRSPV